MFIRKYLLTLLLMCLGVVSLYSQEKRTEFRIGFRVNSSQIDSTYSDNEATLKAMDDFLLGIGQDSTVCITAVLFHGAASPDGSHQFNSNLAKERLERLKSLVLDRVALPDSIIHTDKDNYIQWDYLKAEVESSDAGDKAAIIAILSEQAALADWHRPDTHVDSRVLKLRTLDSGRVWQRINSLYFDRMRNARVVFVTVREELPLEPVAQVQPFTPSVVSDLEPAAEVEETVPSIAEVEWKRRMHLKTNVLGLGMAIANAAPEIDLAKHWSFSLPVYYSTWNYFRSTIKFRTFAIQPEVRWWLSESNNGFFAGLHLGLVSYNIAVDGDYRYQDHNMKTPALGGGLSAGYRLPLDKERHWSVEFSLGAGVYANHYDKFHNTPDTKDGLMVGSVRKTYWGLDQAAVSFSYSFDLKKKGGRR